jgi:DNA-nicking Smr family endonuclease
MAARRKGGSTPGDSDFERAMRGVRPLADRDKQRPPPDPKPTRRRRPEEKPSLRFEIEHHGESVLGLAEGVDPKHLTRLRSGAVEIERRVDLHRMVASQARRRLRQALKASQAAGEACVLVIHGRGHQSVEGPVLKRKLPEWLAEPPLGATVLAFASAPAREGGAGATLVLLRRPRR